MKIYVWKAPKIVGAIIRLFFKNKVEYVGNEKRN